MNAQTIAQAIRQQVQIRPDREALVFLAADGTEQRITYARLHADASRVAGMLRVQGIRPDELVILAFDHGYPLVAAFFGAMYAGAVPSIFPYFTPASTPKAYQGRVRRLVQQVQARAVVTLPALRSVLADSGCSLLVVGEEATGGRAAPDGFALHQADPEDIAYIQFSSGTTGFPKGVCISHRAALNNIAGLSAGYSFGPAGVSVGWVSLSHAMGLARQLLLPLMVGGKSVMMDAQFWVRYPASLFRAIHRYRGTMTWMPNFALAHCLRTVRNRDLENVDLSSWQTLGCSGEPIQFDTLRRFAEQFAPYGLYPQVLTAAYGMSENTVGVAHIPHGTETQIDHVSRLALQTEKIARPVWSQEEDGVDVVSCGVPVPGTDISISDHDDAPLPERYVGEIRICGNSLFSGYYRQPEATARSMRDGWFYTGDVGYLAGGQLYVVDRKKDLIIMAGQNLYPHHIEAMAQAAAGKQIRRAVAFGVRDEKLGTELPVVVVEVRGHLEDAEREQLAIRIRRRLREEMGVSLADVRLVGRGWLELTTSGKIARSANRQKYAEAGFHPPFTELFDLHLSPDSPPEALEAALMRIVATVTGKSDIEPQTSLTDLGVDSLAMMQVLLLIEEKLGRAVPVGQLPTHPTIHHLARLLYDGEEESDLSASAAVALADAYPIGPRGIRRPVGVSRWRWRRNRLLQRGPALRRHALPYGLGTRLLRAMVSQPRLRQALYPREVELLRRCLEAVPVQGDPETVIRQSLMVNSWSGWRRLALADAAAFERWVTVRNAELLERLAAEGRGVVLAVPHTQLKKILRRLPLLQQRRLAVIGNVSATTLAHSGMPRLAEAVARGETLSTAAVRSAQLLSALRVLGAGGLAYVAADDDNGSGGIRVPFHGRWRPFRPGAAELAVQSGAAFVPFFATLALPGHVSLEFLQPLTPQGATHAAQVESLLHQYAALLAGRYTTDLGAMEWYILRKFLRLPVVSPA